MAAIVVIPAFNEEKTVAETISRVPKNFSILVVDDASTDSTQEILAKIVAEKKSEKNFFVIASEKNSGVGASLKKGFEFALERGFDAIFCLDADGQHPPEKLEELSAALEKGVEAVFASRFADGQEAQKIPFLRRAGNRFFSFAAGVLFSAYYGDALCGMRGFRREALEKLLPKMRENGYGSALEMTCLAAREKLRVAEVAIPATYYPERKTSYSLPKMLLALLGALIKTFLRN